ncbi:MAG: hypothetical protein JW774_10265 [Candidatus Aureabacteria bacterium]|nr:hypothetical protein [Candidatus Auribacterota bacterium]
MKKTLLSALVMLGLIGYSYAADLPPDIVIDPPPTTIDIGAMWNFVVDSYRVDVLITPAEEASGVNDPENDTWVEIVDGTLEFGTVNMTGSGIYATTGATGAKAYQAVPHRAGSAWTDTRVFFDNNQCRAQVIGNFSGTIFNINSLPIFPTDPTNESVMHVMGVHMNETSPEGYPLVTAIDNNIVTGTAFATVGWDTTTVTNPVPVVPGDMIFYDCGTGTGGSNYVSDMFQLYFALDYLPIGVPADSYTIDTRWTLHAVSF